MGTDDHVISVRLTNPEDIKNFADPPARPPYVKKTTVKTYILDPAGAATGNGPTQVQICDYEPKRLRLTIQPIDVAVTVTLDAPTKSPDTTSASVAPQGAYLPPIPAGRPYEFFGPDAMWLNSLTAVTRVTVVKEYC